MAVDSYMPHKSQAKVLDALVFTVAKSFILYLGDRDLAEHHFKRHFPNDPINIKPYKEIKQALGPKLIGTIDIDNKYKFQPKKR